MVKKILWVVFSILIIFTIFAGYVGYKLYERFQLFCMEDNVVHSYYPLVNAIHKYKEKHGIPPENLEKLQQENNIELPRNIKKISFKYIHKVNPEDWKLQIIVEFRGIEREFVYSSDHKLTPEEEKRITTGCHGWTVLRINKK